MYIDTHSHLHARDYASDLAEVIARARGAGVETVALIGEDAADSLRAAELANKDDIFIIAAGLHPHRAAAWSDDEAGVIRDLVKRAPRAAAIGEIGLDYHYDHATRRQQRAAFTAQLALARECGMPVVVHCREAYEDAISILREHAGELRGVMHCWFGSIEQARAFVDMGFMLGIGGAVTFPKAAELCDVVRAVPLDHIVLETDAPYMTPAPHRGERNEPAHIPLIASRIAELRGLHAGDVARVTLLNSARLFGLDVENRPVIAYPIRDSLYINLTNRCTALCVFCDRLGGATVKGHNLRLRHEPARDEIIAAIGASGGAGRWDEVVFCGYGEPALRFDLMLDLARWLKGPGGARQVRLNTNGHADLINKRPTLPEMSGLIDMVSVSLNAADEETYNRLVRPFDRRNSWRAMIQFLRDARGYIPNIQATAVAYPGLDLEPVRALATSFGASFRVRHYNEVG
ncbi:MAG: TatD family hydrolase [bacterium]|nr:YchF/TatD family DNA exonuclease [Candidatus Sumerlaeota bacterium]